MYIQTTTSGSGSVNAPLSSVSDPIVEGLTALVDPDFQFEIRILGDAPPKVRLFRNVSEAAAWIQSFDHEPSVHATYVTLNPVNNHWVAKVNAGAIEKRRWFFLDFDPVRPDGPSSDSELQAARDLAEMVSQELKLRGWSDPMRVMSGNGIHLYYRLTEGVQDPTYSSALSAISKKYSTEHVKIDTSVKDLPRITKVPGTWARKGTESPVRPWRRAALEQHWSGSPITEAQLAEWTAVVPSQSPVRSIKAVSKRAKQVSLPQLTPPSVERLRANCPFVEHCYTDAATLSEPEWFAALSMVPLCQNGKEAAHEMSRPYPKYSYEETENKTKRAIDAQKPFSCKAVSDRWDGCKGCLNLAKDSNPLILSRDKRGAGVTVEVDGVQRILLDHADPADSARRLLAASENIVFFEGVFYQHDDGCYSRIEVHALDQLIQRFLDGAAEATSRDQIRPYRANSNRVAEIRKAIERLNLINPGSVPRWLAGTRPQNPRRLVVARGGVLDTDSGQVLPVTSELFAISRLDIDLSGYQTARHELWTTFLNQTFRGNQQRIALLQEVAGAVLAGDRSHQRLFLLLGPSGSGKSTITNVLQRLVGAGAFGTQSLQGLGGEFGLEPLRHRRLVVFPDVRTAGEATDLRSVERLLQITGGDSVSINMKNRPAVTEIIDALLMLVSNEMPSIRDENQALLRRYLIIRTEMRDTGSVDNELTSRLLEELPGIVRWAMEGYERLSSQGGFTRLPTDEFERQLRVRTSPATVFVDECLEVDPDGFVSTSACRQLWSEWCKLHGIRVGGDNAVRERLLALPGVRSVNQRLTGGSRMRGFSGVRLRAGVDAETEPVNDSGGRLAGGAG